MIIGGLKIHHEGCNYHILIPAGSVIDNRILVPLDISVMHVRFPLNGDTQEEANKVKLFIKHLKEIYRFK